MRRSLPPRLASAPRLLGALAALALAACRPESPPPAGPAASSPPPPGAAAALAPVPVPDLGALEAAVAEHLAAGQERLDAALAAGDLPPDRLASLFGEQGVLYLGYGLQATARPCFENAARLAPEDFRWPYYLGHLDRYEGRLEASLASFGRTRSLDPGYLPAALYASRSQLELDRLEAAAETLRAVLAAHPENAALLGEQGRVALAQGDFAAAARALERALELAPGASALHYPLGMAYRGLGKLDEARRLLARRGAQEPPLDDPLLAAVEAVGRGARLAERRGNELFAAGRFGEAVREFRQAAEADPTNAVAQLNLGAALLRAGDRQGAEGAFRRALRLDPDSTLARFNLGTLLAQSGRDAEAVEAYREALRTNPGHRDAHFNLANALRRLGRLGEAEDHYRRASELEPGSGPPRYALAQVLVARRRWREARDLLAESHRALPGDPFLADALARLLAACPADELRDGPRALALAQGLVAAERSLLHLEALAMALAEVGRFAAAAQVQEEVLAAARAGRRADLVPRLAAHLAGYRAGRPCREPSL